MPNNNWLVYLITDRQAVGDRSLLDIVRAAIQGGVTAVQLRDKHANAREMIALGQALHTITRTAGIPLIVNDRLDIALALDAEGIHLGQDDIPADIARRILGPQRLIGISAETVTQARQAEHDGADYLGVGDLFGTPSKTDAGEPIGIKRLATIAQAVTLPIVGIGGITQVNAASVIASGAAGIAVISAIIKSLDPEAATRQLYAITRANQRIT